MNKRKIGNSVQGKGKRKTTISTRDPAGESDRQGEKKKGDRIPTMRDPSSEKPFPQMEGGN